MRSREVDGGEVCQTFSFESPGGVFFFFAYSFFKELHLSLNYLCLTLMVSSARDVDGLDCRDE